MMNHWLRRLAILACFLFAALAAKAASAEGSPAEKCIAAHEKAQVLRLDGSLLEAQQTLQSCSSEACPSFVRGDCIRWLGEVQSEIPTVIFETVTDDGAEANVKVYVEDRLITQHLDGRPIQLDPGAYTFRFEPEGLETKEVRLILRQGEKNKPVSADYRTEKPPPISGSLLPPFPSKPKGRPTRPITVPTYVFASVALASAGAAVYFGLETNKKQQDALDDCGPICDEDTVSEVTTSALITDVAISVSVVSAVTATVLFLTRPTVYVQDTKKDPKAKPKTSAPKVSFGFGPNATSLGLSGRF